LQVPPPFPLRKPGQPPPLSPPPSTTNACPSPNPLRSGSARNRIACAISSGVANRPIGFTPSISASLYPPPAAWSATSISVFTHPGHTAFTRTPLPPHSAARVRVSPTSPCFEAL